MAEQYNTVDYAVGMTSADLAAFYNQYGAQGWDLISVELIDSKHRRAVFKMGAGAVSYFVVDYPTGETAAQLTNDLDNYGVNGWDLVVVDFYDKVTRRAIMAQGPGHGQGGGRGGIPEAPSDGTTYGRNNAAWSASFDGGSF